MIYSLALKMGRTVRELAESMDAAELQHWVTYYELDPWTEDRADLRASTVAAVIANVNSTDRSFRPSDFMPEFGPPVEHTDEEIRHMAVRANAMLGGTFN